MVQETVVEGLRRDVNGSCNDLHDAEQAGGKSMMEKMREYVLRFQVQIYTYKKVAMMEQKHNVIK